MEANYIIVSTRRVTNLSSYVVKDPLSPEYFSTYHVLSMNETKSISRGDDIFTDYGNQNNLKYM